MDNVLIPLEDDRKTYILAENLVWI